MQKLGNAGIKASKQFEDVFGEQGRELSSIFRYYSVVDEKTDRILKLERKSLTRGIPTTIVEKGGILIKGDVAIFKNIKNAKIINKAIVIDSFNKVKKEQNEEVAGALLHIGEFIEKSGNVSAGILFDKFNEELNKPKPEKSTLRKIWDGIEKTLPTIVTIADIVTKLAPLF